MRGRPNDPVAAKAKARAHARRSHTCTCGTTVWGNGGKSSHRAKHARLADGHHYVGYGQDPQDCGCDRCVARRGRTPMRERTLPPKKRGHVAEQYRSWIEDRYPDRLTAVGACSSATLAMVATFPELRRMRGYCGTSEHWWCETQTGEVVDPTAAQFGEWDLDYCALDESRPQPTGYCVNRCGAYTWDYAEFCSDECREQAEADRDADMRDLGYVRQPDGSYARARRAS